VVQEARLGQGDEDIPLGAVDAVAPAGLVLGARVAIGEDLVVPRLGAGHVDFVGGSRDPTKQRLLQLHPQDVALVLRWGGRDGHPLPHRCGVGGCRWDRAP